MAYNIIIMRFVFPVLVFILMLTTASNGQTFTGTGGAIPDNDHTVSFTIPVDELPNPALSTVYGLESVCLNIYHNWVEDLEIALIAPDSTYVDLAAFLGGGGHHFTNTCFSGNSESFIIFENAPFTGTFRPVGDLGIMNNGQAGTGEWKLLIHDKSPYSNQGTLTGWSLTFGDEPSMPFPFESSSLPIVFINTLGEFIPDDPKIMARMGIIDNGSGQRNFISDPWNGYDGYIGIERRGSSSQGFPKKSFGFETWDEQGEDIDVSLMGMPEESDWILNAHYTDKTLLRNGLTYYLSNRMGRYATRTQMCELVLNGQYWGVYAFMEKIKRDKERVDIAKLEPEDTTGLDVTGGYILKIDKITGSGGEGWISSYPPIVHNNGQEIYIQYEYPGYDELEPQQTDYIQNYVDSLETALFAYQGHDIYRHHQYMDIGSFVDYFILCELSKNIDAYRLSTFFYKDKEGRINMGPVWDFDLAWGNANYCEAQEMDGWVYQFGQVCPQDEWQIPFWWEVLMTDSVFLRDLKCRWTELRHSVLDFDTVHNYINEQIGLINEAQQRNFTQWPILGVWIWPNPWPLPTTYSEETYNLKSFIMARLTWLDSHMPGVCVYESVNEEGSGQFIIYPNPAADRLYIRFMKQKADPYHLELYNAWGQLLRSGEAVLLNDPDVLDLSGIPAGIYILKIRDQGETLYTQKIVKTIDW